MGNMIAISIEKANQTVLLSFAGLKTDRMCYIWETQKYRWFHAHSRFCPKRREKFARVIVGREGVNES
jgi:hypothetical protein